jgi:hypothetical protein
MVTHLNDSMVNTRNGRTGAKASQANGPNPPLPPTLAQVIASILELRDEQTELLHQLMNNYAHGGNGLGTPKDRLQPPMESFWPLIR